MEEIRIVEYSHAWAEKVADMWRRSAEGWNGMNMPSTAEAIILDHNNSHHLNVYLAVNGDGEVVGYCSLSKYTQDEGTLYINLLNVRPDYHGKKVGKMLVLTCVDRTMALGAPRLDLNTWPGNTKAVPLYKKCGFFWEKRDDSTHLMNFIPTVIKTEALTDFFQDAHWYRDSKRIIEVKPDGRRENGFDYLEYSWEHSDRHLRVEFERTGRGIRLIETDDYLISTEIQQHELVFGMDYEVTYHIVNKSGKPLKIELKGKDDRNITFNMNHAAEVPGTSVLKGLFRVNPVTEVQNPVRTHPGVVTEAFINGKRVVFKTGILPAYPADITLHVPGRQCYLNQEARLILDMQNKFNCKAVFHFTLKPVQGILFPKPEHSVTLESGQRTTVEIPYILQQELFYSEALCSTASLPDGTLVPFEKRLEKSFTSRQGIIWGEGVDFCEIINGPYIVHLNKQDNSIWASRIYADQHNLYRIFPKVGHPFSAELSSKKADRIDCYRDGEAVIMAAVYTLNDFPGLRLSSITRLENSGILRYYYEMENIGETETDREVCLSDTFRQDLFRGVLPYDDGFVKIGADTNWTSFYWDSSRITENWMFSYGDYTTRGVCWEPDQRIRFDDWCMFFEHSLGKIPAGRKVATKPVTVAMDVFDRWQDFRAFALKEDIIMSPHAVKHTALSVNQGNPFVEGDVEITLKEYRNLAEPPVLTVTNQTNSNPGLITATVEVGSFTKELQTVIFRKGSNPVSFKIETISGKKVYTVNNGLISMRACPAFSYALYSLRYRENEWLDSSFPTPGIKAWWNPWSGGISLNFPGISPISLMDEDRKACFVTLPDNFGNTWSGIKMSVHISKNEKSRGLTLNLYSLTMPGLPVLCNLVRILQDTGRHFPWQYVENGFFIKTDPEISNNHICFITKDGERLRLTAGKNQYFITSLQPLLYESPNRQEKLLVYTDTENQLLEVGVNSSMLMAFAGMHREMRNGDKIAFPPAYLIFTEDYYKADLLQDLKNIQFNFGGETHEGD